MKKDYIDINSIREKDFIDFSLKDFISPSELELYNTLYKEYFEKIKNYLLSKTLRRIRTHFSLTQKELAEKIGKSEILIRKYEKGSIKINDNVILLIIKTFSLNFSVFYDFLKDAFNEFNSSSKYYELHEKYFLLLLSFKSFQNLNDIAESFIKGELEISKLVIQNIVDTFFYNNSFNNKIDTKNLQNEINFIEYLEKNNYIVSEYSETEITLKKENCHYKFSIEKLSEISSKVISYTEFLLSELNKTQK